MRQDFLQLSRCDQTAGKRQRTDNHFQSDLTHLEAGDGRRSYVVLGNANQGRGKRAERMTHFLSWAAFYHLVPGLNVYLVNIPALFSIFPTKFQRRVPRDVAKVAKAELGLFLCSGGPFLGIHLFNLPIMASFRNFRPALPM